jgi:hypothetical protein
MSLRAKMGCFTPFLRGNLVDDGGDCFDPCGKTTRTGSRRGIASYITQMSLRAKMGCFTPFLRGNLVDDGGDCFDPCGKTTRTRSRNDRMLMMLPNLLLEQIRRYSLDERERMRNTVLLITGEGMGRGELELQRQLIGKYFSLLLEANLLPNSICFYADGVKLAVTGSPVLDQLRLLEQQGVRLILCSTCLNFYGLADQMQVGIVGGMSDILAAQSQAERVITL